MTTWTVNLPDNLAKRIETHGITEEDLNAIIIRFIQLYLDENSKSTQNLPLKIGGAEFARQLINNNRQLFEELAKH